MSQTAGPEGMTVTVRSIRAELSAHALLRHPLYPLEISCMVKNTLQGVICEMDGYARDIKLFSGTANPKLSEAIARHMGMELGHVNIQRFPTARFSCSTGIC